MTSQTPHAPAQFANMLRGRVAERILITLLERGGYRVTKLGIEEIFDEIKVLTQSEYLALQLPPALRALPDILVADPQVSWAALIELKFRRRFDEEVARELRDTLASQRQHWPTSSAIVMIAEPFVASARFHQDYVRVVLPGRTDDLLPPPSAHANEGTRMHAVWEALPSLVTLFHVDHIDSSTEAGVQRRWAFFAAMDYITQALKELKNF